MQVRYAPAAVAATEALSECEGGKVLSVSGDKVGGKQNAPVLTARHTATSAIFALAN